MPAISVVIPHYDNLAALEACLAALDLQTLGRELFEIVVADNGSPCGLEAIATLTNGRARLVAVAERGAGPARNGGVAQARSACLAFLDCDCVPDPEWLAAGLEALRTHRIAGGRVRVQVRDPRHPSPTEAFEIVFAFDFESYILRKGFSGSGNLFVSRPVFEHVGGFRVNVSEDRDWCLRARSIGYAITYEPRAAVAHPARVDWPELKAKWLRIQKESYHLACNEPGGRIRWLLRSLAMPFSIPPHALRVLLHPALPDLTSRLGAIGILVRQRMWRFVDGPALLLGLRT